MIEPPGTLARFVWQTRYRSPDARPIENDISDTWARVARAAAAVEPAPDAWCERFLAILRDYRFLPGGRILAGAGTSRQVTLCNCFVVGTIADSVEGIFEALKESAVTMQQGGGIGCDFSTLRPRGSHARTTGMIASGPVSFMRVWDAMCATILSTGARRGAMMATLRCDHPDIEEFIDAKRAPDALLRFNLSVLVTDAFMQAVRSDSDWPLVFPERDLATAPAGAARVERIWSGASAPAACRVSRVVRARELWSRLCASAFDTGEPGVLFVDRINSANNLAYCESLSACNPCGEEPLPPHGACTLGSLNLAAFVREPFAAAAGFDDEAIRATTHVAVRFLDDILEISRFPLFRQREQARRSRRIGLGVTGLADALAMLGLRYDTERGRAAASHAMRTVRDAAYAASIELAKERGPFPAFVAEKYLERPFIRALPDELQTAMGRHGIRNSHLLAVAPAGTISLLASNVSSGIEPIFGIESVRRVLDHEDRYHNFQVTDPAYALWRTGQSGAAELPQFFVDRDAISPRDHLLMQAALQPYVDGAISKTVALGAGHPKSEVSSILEAAYDLGVKGCTLYRTAARADVPAERFPGEAATDRRVGHCRETERESD